MVVGVCICAPAICPGQVVESQPFLGVTLYSITLTVPRPLNIRVVEIDLRHPGLAFRMSPRDPGLPDGDETITQTTRQYVDEQSAQIGINTSFFRLENGLEARPTNNTGIVVSDGDRYSPWDSGGQVGLNISEANVANVITAASSRPTGFESNPSGVSLFNAVAGSNRLLNNGDNVAPANSPDPGAFLHLQPRTAAGVTADDRLLLATIDGRRAGFSEGMYLSEVAELLKGYGATNAVNLDGGGSTTLAMDYYDDGATRAQLVNRPSGSERHNGVSLGIFAPRNPGYVPPTGVVGVPGAVGSVRVLDDFEDGVGRFSTDPDFSGSNRGLRENTDGVGPSTSPRTANDYFHGFAAQQISIVSQDDPTWDGFRLRHLSGGGDPANNEHLGTAGFIGYWLKTTTPGLTTAINLDENLTRMIESGVARDVVADGEWHLYEWNLADPAQWDSFSNGDGDIDGPITTADSIFVSSLIDQDATVWFDGLSYNPNGSVASLVPEPAGIVVVLSLVPFAPRRRRHD
jgi:hypothetical protein